MLDLEAADEAETAKAVEGMDAVVFAAGAGPGSGPERKLTMDYGGAAKLIAAALANDVPRYVMVSSQNADPDAEGDDTFAVYLRAKGKADEELQNSGLDYTIVRPTHLTERAGRGHRRGRRAASRAATSAVTTWPPSSSTPSGSRMRPWERPSRSGPATRRSKRPSPRI